MFAFGKRGGCIEGKTRKRKRPINGETTEPQSRFPNCPFYSCAHALQGGAANADGVWHTWHPQTFLEFTKADCWVPDPKEPNKICGLVVSLSGLRRSFENIYIFLFTLNFTLKCLSKWAYWDRTNIKQLSFIRNVGRYTSGLQHLT